MTLLQLRVARKQPQGTGICSLELQSPDGQPLPPFTAGAHVDLHLPGGLVRPYSLCGDPTDTRSWRLGVLRTEDSRGGSLAVHDRVHEGDRVQVSLPRNAFAPDPHAPFHLLLAGGIGLTPLLSMAWALWRAGRPFALHLGVRTRDRIPFADELAAAPFADRVTVHVSREAGGARIDPAPLLAAAPSGAHLCVCGPAGFIEAALDRALVAGWDASRLHSETFGATVAPRAGADEAFEVELASSGRVLTVAAGQTVVHALRQAGLDPLTSCEQGVCGTCLTRVLNGVPDHRDQYLTDEERAAGDQFLPCCSRSRSPRLVLDL